MAAYRTHVPRHCAWSLSPSSPSRAPLARGEPRTASLSRGTAVVRLAATGTDVPAQTPHSGYHWDHINRDRFFEGWYFRVAIPEGPSFAWMYSIEDPAGGGTFSGVGAQVMGPEDGYLIQHSPSVRTFWASSTTLELGDTFQLAAGRGSTCKGMVEAEEFSRNTETGFQASATRHQGSLVVDVGRAGRGPESTVEACRWCYHTTPVYGWGGNTQQQQLSTAGWLAALPVFEPHWQILMSKGLSTGWVEWGERRFEFTDAPTYSEKNWGGAFPLKWFWMQCNSFQEEPQLAITVGGGRRKLPIVSGATENVALIGIHWCDEFIGLTPWEGSIDWEVDTWGRWLVRGSNASYDAEVLATCAETDGTKLRAPTADEGLAGFCRDTFSGHMTLRVWRKGTRFGTGAQVLCATSTSAALEVGGGPWWTTWKERAQMSEPLRAILNAPLPIEAALDNLPAPFRPPGL